MVKTKRNKRGGQSTTMSTSSKMGGSRRRGRGGSNCSSYKMGGSRRRGRGGQDMGYGAASTGVSNMASGVESTMSNVGNTASGFFSNIGSSLSGAVNYVKQKSGLGSSNTGTMGGRRRRRKGGQAEVVGFNEQWDVQGPAVGGRRRRKH